MLVELQDYKQKEGGADELIPKLGGYVPWSAKPRIPAKS